jgi:hypothetical protein
MTPSKAADIAETTPVHGVAMACPRCGSEGQYDVEAWSWPNSIWLDVNKEWYCFNCFLK